MASQAQITANQANAQHSTGPKSVAGKAASSVNHLCHGLVGTFAVLAWEKEEEFDALLDSVRAEHQPVTPTENLLVQNMAQHYWLSRRALFMQDLTLNLEIGTCDAPKDLALYMRYQATHDRAFHKSLNALLKLRAEKRKIEIGFESQNRKRDEDARKRDEDERKRVEEARRDAAELRKQEMHEARLRAINSHTLEREIDNDIRQTIEAPLPGHMRVPFETMKDVFKVAIHEVGRQLNAKATAA